jgi:Helix-turn-helix domain
LLVRPISFFAAGGGVPLADEVEGILLRELSQATLAEALDTDQGNISKLEQRTDMYISTLRRYVEAMGGTLEIVAKFPDGAVRVTQFQELAEAAAK